MSTYTADTLDFSRLDPPTLVDVDGEARLVEFRDKFVELWGLARAINPALPVFDTEKLDQDAAIVILQAFTYGDTVLRAATNDAANSLRLPFATGADLDYLAQTYHRTVRRTLIPADPQNGVAAIMEGDPEYLFRAQLAPEATADLGLTPGGYVYKVLSAFTDRVKGVFPINRGAGRVELRILGRQGDGTVSLDLIAEIVDAFRAEEGTQSTDVLTIFPAEIVHVTPSVTLYVPSGPDRSTVKAKASASIKALGASLHRINAAVYREAVSSAAHVGPVITVRVDDPLVDLAGRPEAAPFFDEPVIAFGVLE